MTSQKLRPCQTVKIALTWLILCPLLESVLRIFILPFRDNYQYPYFCLLNKQAYIINSMLQSSADATDSLLLKHTLQLQNSFLVPSLLGFGKPPA